MTSSATLKRAAGPEAATGRDHRWRPPATRSALRSGIALAVLTDSADEHVDMLRSLRRVADCEVMRPNAPGPPPDEIDAMVVDLDLRKAGSQRLLSRMTEGREDAPLIMLTRGPSEAPRYTSGQRRTMLLPDAAPKDAVADLVLKFIDPNLDAGTVSLGRSLERSTAVLEAILAPDIRRPLDFEAVDRASEQLLGAVELNPVSHWLEVIRAHHKGTFLHCLSVAGIMAHFATNLGFATADKIRLMTAAFVHDIGKSMVPVAILDKPGRLDDEEMRIMRTHAEHGHRILVEHGLADPMILAMTRHHHELLNGKGYPDRLQGDAIPDHVRLLTICDIYAALIEERSYKRAFTQSEAFEILFAMADELDQVLVRRFAESIREPA